MINLIALDLDGTLMYTDHITVTEGNRSALAKAHEKNIKIAISTGRTLAIIGDVCEQVPDIDYVIYSNGAVVYDRKQNKNVYSKCMDFKMCEPMLKKSLEIGGFVEVYIDGKDYVQKDKVDTFGADFLPKEFLEKFECYKSDLKKENGFRPWESENMEKNNDDLSQDSGKIVVEEEQEK